MAIEQEQKNKELDLWKDWKTTGNKKALTSLMTSYNPVVNTLVSRMGKSSISPTNLRSEAKRLMYNAFETFNPKKAALNTHVYTNLQPMFRYLAKYQNIGFIPENRFFLIGKYAASKAHLESTLDREPTTSEMADKLSWSPNMVNKIDKESKGSMTTMPIQSFGSLEIGSPVLEAFKNIYHALPNKEKLAIEYLLGYGKPKLPIRSIVKKTGLSENAITQLRLKVKNDMRSWLNE